MKNSEKNNNALVKQITYASLSLALGIVLISLSYATVFSDLLIILFVPFLGAFTSIKTNWKGQLLFIIGCLCISFIDIQEGFFSFLPNVLMGIAYGDLVKKFSLSFYSFLGALTVSLLIEIGLTYPINFFYQVDLIKVYATVFHLDKEIFISIFPAFYFLLSAVQTTITSIILSGELKKVAKIPPELFKEDFWPLAAIGAVLMIIFSISYFYVKWLAYLSLCYFALLACWTYVSSFRVDRKSFVIIYASLGVISLLLSGFSFSLLSKTDYYLSLIPLLIYFFLTGLCMIEYSHKHKEETSSLDSKRDLLEKNDD